MNSSTSVEGDHGRLYIGFMQELKDRLLAVREMMQSLPPGGGRLGYMTAKICILQVRLMCEILALACLSAHEPLGLTKKLKKTWHANDVFSALTRINPRCFPRPIRTEIANTGELSFHVVPETGLSRFDLQKSTIDAENTTSGCRRGSFKW